MNSAERGGSYSSSTERGVGTEGLALAIDRAPRGLCVINKERVHWFPIFIFVLYLCARMRTFFERSFGAKTCEKVASLREPRDATLRFRPIDLHTNRVGQTLAAETPRPGGVFSSPREDIGRGGGVQIFLGGGYKMTRGSALTY